VRGRGWEKREGQGGKRGEMTQSLYAHMNKGNKKKLGFDLLLLSLGTMILVSPLIQI
jgi:hypothetical protein